MPALNLDLDYFTHPKIVRLTGLIGAEHVAIPIKLWCYTAKYHCASGILEGYSKHEIESALGWTGPSELLVDALLKVGLLETKGKNYVVHDWKEHAGHFTVYKKRAKTAAKKRWDKYATSIPQACLTNAPAGQGRAWRGF